MNWFSLAFLSAPAWCRRNSTGDKIFVLVTRNAIDEARLYCASPRRTSSLSTMASETSFIDFRRCLLCR